ncbi:MAG: flavin reductase family protein [Gemmatimonadota bacterium]
MAGGHSITGSVRAGVDDADPRTPLQREFGEALSRWASGVAVVAVRNGPSIAAITATAFTSVSLDPPLILVCVGDDATVSPPLLAEGERFGVSILREEQRRLASMYADRGPLARERFAGEGDPVLEDALAALGCVVREIHPAGDHHVVIGEADRVETGPSADSPLLYYRREYRALG